MVVPLRRTYLMSFWQKYYLFVLHPRCMVEWFFTVFIHNRWICAMLYQGLCGIGRVIFNSSMKCSTTKTILCIYICSIAQQFVNEVCLTDLCCPMERCASILIMTINQYSQSQHLINFKDITKLHSSNVARNAFWIVCQAKKIE